MEISFVPQPGLTTALSWLVGVLRRIGNIFRINYILNRLLMIIKLAETNKWKCQSLETDHEVGFEK